MTTRLGKIAQLPKPIRDDLNQRLENGQQSPELLAWLNSLPKTKKLIAKQFDRQPITKSNLSHWRHGGFQDWRKDQARQARIQRISESGTTLEQAQTGDLFENFARIAVAELAADLDDLPKLRGEKRSQYLHNLVRDLARLQNSFNRSRWAELAWTKYNDSLPPEPEPDLPGTAGVPPASPCPSTSVAPGCTQSQVGDVCDSKPKRPYNPFKSVHYTRCDCNDPCPKCHASDSEYPVDEVLRDKKFRKEHGVDACDRYGDSKLLMNFDCDCFCDRCAEKMAAPIPSPLCGDLNPGRVALPRNPIIHHAEARDENSTTILTPQPAITPIALPTYDPRADFLRKMAHLKKQREPNSPNSSNQQPYRRDDGKPQHHGFESGLVDSFQDHGAEQGAGNHRETQEGVHAEGVGGD
jgi:hypothetical protein